MVRVDDIHFKNRATHLPIQNDNDVHLYAMNGNLYTRQGKSTPRLVAGLIVYEGSGGTTNTSNTRAGRVTLNTESKSILFATTLGVTGLDYNLYFDVFDADGAMPAFNISNRTRFGFTVTVYDNNINFGWKAELNTQ